MFNSWVGIDVSKDTLDVVILQRDENKHKKFSNDLKGCKQLDRWLKRQPNQEHHVCMEATGQYSLLSAEHLYQEDFQVSVVNPLRIKAYGQSRLVRNKTDRLDAFVIADFCRSQTPPAWEPPSAAVRELQSMVRYLDSLKDLRQQERNRLSSGVASVFVVQLLNDHIASLDQQIKTLQDQIFEYIDQHPELKSQKDLLVSIPGIGNLTAAKLLAEIPDISTFDSPAQLAAFAGVTPRQHLSGSSVRGKARQSKTGNAHLRKALYFPAMAACKHNPIIRAQRQRLLDRGKLGKVIIGAAMRKLLHIAYGVIKSGQPFDPNFASAS
jgi:transposase